MSKTFGGTTKKEKCLDVLEEKILKTTSNTKKENVGSAIQKQVNRDNDENSLNVLTKEKFQPMN